MPFGRIIGGLANLIKAPLKIANFVAPFVPGAGPIVAKLNLGVSLADQLFNRPDTRMQGSNEFARLLQLQQEYNRILAGGAQDIR